MAEESSGLEVGIEIPFESLSADALRGVVEAFVLCEGTDYGPGETPLDQKVAQVVSQLKGGEAKILFDPVRQECVIVPASRGYRG